MIIGYLDPWGMWRVAGHAAARALRSPGPASGLRFKRLIRVQCFLGFRGLGP